jgi:hypothetical protein
VLLGYLLCFYVRPRWLVEAARKKHSKQEVTLKACTSHHRQTETAMQGTAPPKGALNCAGFENWY